MEEEDSITTTNCWNCRNDLGEVGGRLFRTCEHPVCTLCICGILESAEKWTIRCISNPNKGTLKCGGFLNAEDIKWIVPEEIYEEYEERVRNKPGTSRQAVEQPEDEEEEEEEDEWGVVTMTTAPLKTFDELDLSEEELRGGWGQVATMIQDMMEDEGLSFEAASAQMDLIPLWGPIQSLLPIQCPICIDDIERSEEGVILKGCFHIFHRECLGQHIIHAEDAEVPCPFREGDYACDSVLKPKEVENLVPRQIYLQHYEKLSLEEAQKDKLAFHCLTPNCSGFCYLTEGAEGTNVLFTCPICGANNCSACKITHQGTCADYKKMLQDREDERNRRENERLSEEMINGHINQRNFMRCPKCGIPCYKFTGCNHMICASCKTNFGWIGNANSVLQ